MFFSQVKTEPIPERVLELCRIVNVKAPLSRSELAGIFEPEKLYGSNTHYFGNVLEAAKELGLIAEADRDMIIFIGDKAAIKTSGDFRRYCNSKVFTEPTSDFYKTAECFLKADDSWLKLGSLTTSEDIKEMVSRETGIPTLTLGKDVLLGMRFWLNFLGFGYVQEKPKIIFLPNMYTALKDFLALGDISKGQEYSVREFLDGLHSCSSVALKGAREAQRLDLAMSNALRTMHDNKEIELKNNPDSAERWELFYNESHPFQSGVTHIIVKAVK